MKKLLTTLLCVALAAASVIGLTACKNDPGEQGDGNQGNTLDLTASADWVDANLLSTDPLDPHAGDPVYTFNTGTDKSKQMSPITVTKYNTGEYSALNHNLGASDITGYKKLVIKAKAGSATYTPNPVDENEAVTEAATLMIKLVTDPGIGGGNEFTVELSETEKTFEFKLDYEDYEYALAGAQTLTLIAGPGKPNYNAEITVSAVYFTDEATVDANVINKTPGVVQIPIVYNGEDKIDVNRGWATHDGNVMPTYDKETKVTSISVPGSKTQYEFVRTYVTGDLKPLTKVRIKFKAPAGTKFKFKIEYTPLVGFETNDAMELAAVATGEEQTWEFNFADMGGWKDAETNLPAGAGEQTGILIMPAPNTTAVSNPYVLEILELELLK